MGSQNIFALIVGLAACAGWTIFGSTVTRRMRWVSWLGGAAILALLFSLVSPDDDALQQELLRPRSPSATASSHTKVAQRGLLADLSVNAFAAEDPIPDLRRHHLVVLDQPFDRLTHFQAPISVHSPPTT